MEAQAGIRTAAAEVDAAPFPAAAASAARAAKLASICAAASAAALSPASPVQYEFFTLWWQHA
jgi:hypothetical protein